MIKLNNTNYLPWKLQLEARIHPLQQSIPTHTTWVRQDKLLFGALIGTLDSFIVLCISGATKEALDILAHTFARHSRDHAKLIKANMHAITENRGEY